jgi:lysophospholipase L1-like esterase
MTKIRLALALAALLLGRGAPAFAQAVDEPAPRLGADGRTIEPFWLKKHEELTALAGRGGARAVFLGDSITEYWRDNAIWKERYAPLGAANFGVAGDTTENVLWRLAQGELTGENPKLFVVLIGTNNLGRGDPPDQAARGTTAVVAAVRARFPSAKILLLGIFPRGERADDPYRDKVRQANALLAPLDDGTTVFYLDVGPSLLESDGSLSADVVDVKEYMHPTLEGYRRWADAMDPLLHRLLDAEGD